MGNELNTLNARTDPTDLTAGAADASGHGMFMVHNPNLRKCAYCGKDQGSVKLKKCNNCRAVAYCDKECQRSHWHAHHKNVCQKILHVASGRHQHKTFKECFGMMGTDFHAWHEKDGKVYGLAEYCGIVDLPDGDKVYPPRFNRRKKYKRALASELKAWSRDRWQKYVVAKETRDGELGDVNTVLKALNERPHMRVFALMHFFPEHFTDKTLRFGSLGYENEDGSVFWEYG